MRHHAARRIIPDKGNASQKRTLHTVADTRLGTTDPVPRKFGPTDEERAYTARVERMADTENRIGSTSSGADFLGRIARL